MDIHTAKKFIIPKDIVAERGYVWKREYWSMPTLSDENGAIVQKFDPESTAISARKTTSGPGGVPLSALGMDCLDFQERYPWIIDFMGNNLYRICREIGISITNASWTIETTKPTRELQTKTVELQLPSLYDNIKYGGLFFETIFEEFNPDAQHLVQLMVDIAKENGDSFLLRNCVMFALEWNLVEYIEANKQMLLDTVSGGLYFGKKVYITNTKENKIVDITVYKDDQYMWPSKDFSVYPSTTMTINTKIKMNIPEGYKLILNAREVNNIYARPSFDDRKNLTIMLFNGMSHTAEFKTSNVLCEFYFVKKGKMRIILD